MTDPSSPNPTPRTRPRAKNRFIGPALVGLWLIAMVAVYFVIVQLKRGGVDGIRVEPSQEAATPDAEVYRER